MQKAASEDLNQLTTAEHLARMRRRWRLQHLGWAAIAALVLAGAIGLFGSGPVSSTTRSAEGLTVEFGRFVRRGAPFTIKASIPVAPGSTQTELWLPRDYLGALRISSVLPHPVQVVSGPEWAKYVFAADHPASSLTVDIHAEAIELGVLEGGLAAGSARLGYTQFVWP